MTTGIILGLALIICAIIASYTALSVKSQGQTIKVTGSAYKPIRSNLAVWKADISAMTTTVESGYAQLKTNVAELEEFLQQQGYAESDYTLSPVNINKRFNRDGDLTGYELTRLVSMENSNVEAITSLAVEASGLIEHGIMIRSRPVTYLFTGLDSLKLEMIQMATENAKERALRLANTTEHDVGAPIGASVGVFQIRALRSQEVSSWGVSDVSSIDKEIVSTVHVEFLID